MEHAIQHNTEDFYCGNLGSRDTTDLPGVKHVCDLKEFIICSNTYKSYYIAQIVNVECMGRFVESKKQVLLIARRQKTTTQNKANCYGQGTSYNTLKIYFLNIQYWANLQCLVISFGSCFCKPRCTY
jgi:hypothetical protein